MMRPFPQLTALVCAMASVAGPAAARAAAADPPPPQALAQGWEYRPDPGDDGRKAGWWRDGGGDGWTPVSVPHVFDPRALDSTYRGTVGWYRLRLTPPTNPDGVGWLLRFGQARRVARAWLNGRDIGGHTGSPYVPFSIFARGLAPGRENTLVVRIDNRRRRNLREGWWNWGGLTRPVELVPVGRMRLFGLGLLGRLRCHAGCRASVLVDGAVRNNGPVAAAPTVEVALTSPSGVVSTHTERLRALAPGAKRAVRFHASVAGVPELWSPERPQLYDATVRVRVGEAVVQVERLRIGLRSVRVRHGLLYLNGRQLNLRGASIHEDLPGRGPALDDADIDRIVADLRSLGANVTRAHYLLDERLLSRFDREGILVWSQAANYHADRSLRTRAGRARALEAVRGTVLAARNHPSVLTHSVANELSPRPDRVRGTGSFLVRAARLTRRLDPTLPVSVDLLSRPGFPRQRAYAEFDLLGINSYFGWYRSGRGHYLARLGNLRPYLAAVRARYPRQALMITEFGAEAAFNGPATEKGTYDFQAVYLNRVLDMVDRRPWLAGAIYWTAREFAVRPRWAGGLVRAGLRPDAIHSKGLIAYDGTPKPAAEAARRRFDATPIYAR